MEKKCTNQSTPVAQLCQNHFIKYVKNSKFYFKSSTQEPSNSDVANPDWFNLDTGFIHGLYVPKTKTERELHCCEIPFVAVEKSSR